MRKLDKATLATHVDLLVDMLREQPHDVIIAVLGALSKLDGETLVEHRLAIRQVHDDMISGSFAPE